MQEWQSSSGSVLAKITSGGYLQTPGIIGSDALTAMLFPGTRSVSIGNTVSLGGGQLVLGINNATTIPTSNPTGGGILYVDSGNLKYRDPNGAITPISFQTVTTQSSWTGAVSLTQTDTMGTYLFKQLTGNTTVTLAAGITGQTYSCTLELQQDTTGSRTIILKGARTSYGVALVLTTTASAIDIIRLEWNGTYWTAFMSAPQVSVPAAWV